MAKLVASSNNHLYALIQRPVVQYAVVLLAAYVALLIIGFIVSLSALNIEPLVAFLPILAPVLFGIGFLLTGRGLVLLGVKLPDPKAVLNGAVIATILASVLTVLNTITGSSSSANLIAVFLFGPIYPICWRIVRTRQPRP